MSSCSSIRFPPPQAAAAAGRWNEAASRVLVDEWARAASGAGVARRGGSLEPTAVPEAPLCARPASLDPLEHETSRRGPLTKSPTMAARRGTWGDVYSLHTLLLSMSSGPARRLPE